MRQANLNYPRKMLRAYSLTCKSLCQEIGMNQTAFDILLFLANNPEFHTARDIVEVRGIKASLVSMNVEKLVREGFLERRPVPGDRRKTMLVCTGKAQSVIEAGRHLQERFFGSLFDGVDGEAREVFCRVLERVEENLDKILEGWNEA